MIICRSEDWDDQSRVIQYPAAVQWNGIAKYVGKIQPLVNAMKNFRSVGELRISENKEGLSQRDSQVVYEERNRDIGQHSSKNNVISIQYST